MLLVAVGYLLGVASAVGLGAGIVWTAVRLARSGAEYIDEDLGDG